MVIIRKVAIYDRDTEYALSLAEYISEYRTREYKVFAFSDQSKLENIVQLLNDVFCFQDLAEEYFYLLAMNLKCKPISFFEVTHGTYNSSLVGVRESVIRALLCGATNIVIIHNHPSGTTKPSQEDIVVTKRIKEASELVGINFCDHLIIGREGYFSFNEQEMIRRE